jgi:hypothetical protein
VPMAMIDYINRPQPGVGLNSHSDTCILSHTTSLEGVLRVPDHIKTLLPYQNDI